MLKTKKRSFCLILSLVMILAMACGAWAATAQLEAGAGQNVISTDKEYDIVAPTGERSYGVYAHDGGTIKLSGDVTTDGRASYALYADKTASIDATGELLTSGEYAHGIYANDRSAVIHVGPITTNDNYARGIHATSSTVTQIGDITTNGQWAHALMAQSADITYSGVAATNNPDAYAVFSGTSGNSTFDLSDSTLQANADNGTAIRIEGANTTVSLSNVTAEGDTVLYMNSESAAVTAANNSTLSGDVLQEGDASSVLGLNLENSALTGAVTTPNDGVVNTNLENSVWYITADSDTNGKLTGGADSLVDFNGTTDTITVAIDSLEGNPSLNIKIGDTLIIKNSSSTIMDISSSNPEVIEIVIDSDTGEITLISKSDGDAEVTYTYIDGNGDEQTVMFGVSSGTGSTPSSYSGGSSSNCNAGMGASALLSLLGLALVAKKK